MRHAATLATLAVAVSVAVAGEAGHVASAAAPASQCGRFPPLPLARPAPIADASPTQFELFRRPQEPADAGLETASNFRRQLSDQLMSYDPTLNRQVRVPPVKQLFGRHAGYIVVGQGSAAEFTLEKLFPCARSLSPDRRRVFQHALNLERLFRPHGLAYCFVDTYGMAKSPPSAVAGAECDTFRNIDSGYGMNEIFDAPVAPSVAGLVPDAVAAVTLRYRQRIIHATVIENVFWTRVPRLPPLQTGVGKSPPVRVLRALVLEGLPKRIDWLAADGHVIRSFTPPRSVVRLLIRRDQACIAINCGR